MDLKVGSPFCLLGKGLSKSNYVLGWIWRCCCYGNAQGSAAIHIPLAAWVSRVRAGLDEFPGACRVLTLHPWLVCLLHHPVCCQGLGAKGGPRSWEGSPLGSEVGLSALLQCGPSTLSAAPRVAFVRAPHCRLQ